MRFNNKLHMDKSAMVQAQDQLMKKLVFGEMMGGGGRMASAFEENQESMGASIETQHLQAALVQRIKDLDNCRIIQKRVVEIKPAKDPGMKPIVILDDGTEIESTLLVGSDGEKSMTRNMYGIGASGYNYN